MKNLPLKLGIFVVLLFALTIAACLLYKPLRLRWYESKLDAKDIETRRRAVEKLLSLGPDGKKIFEKHILGKDRQWVFEFAGEPVGAFTQSDSDPQILTFSDDIENGKFLVYDRFRIEMAGNGTVESVLVKQLSDERRKIFESIKHGSDLMRKRKKTPRRRRVPPPK
ncbi:MAG: hypothetical protein ACYS8W_07590 [Planctomycetota bacterium]|jgi:hypothetical protein